MEEDAKRFARRILLIHLLLLLVVLAVVAMAASEIYNRTREQLIEQATGKQEMLANQTVSGIESYYDSILNNLDLMRRAENDEPGAEHPTPAPPTLPERTVANGVGPGGVGSPVGGPARAAIVGPILWKQLEGRVSLLFSIERATLAHPAHAVRMIGSSDTGLSAEDVVAQARAWLESVETPSVSPFQMFGNVGANLICVPYPRGRLVIAVVPIREIETKFIRPLDNAADTGAWLIDEQKIAMAASRPELVRMNMQAITDPHIHQLSTEYVQYGRADTQVVSKPFTIGIERFVPAMVSAEPIHVGGETWELFIASSMSQVDGVVSRLFRRAMWWGIFVVIAITGILVSTAVQMIRSRLRMERVEHEMLTREVNRAREIQLAWLPVIRPLETAVDIAAINTPASQISGDFYNWFDLPDGRLVLTIGDVTGHGMSAAFLMATTQLLVRNTMARLGDPAACLEEVNRQLCVQVFNGQFVTMLVLVIDTAAGILDVATAGHPAPLLADGESFQPLPIEPQLVLGVERDTKFFTERYTLPPRCRLLLYTDGVVECSDMHDARFGSDGLRETLYGRHENAQAILDHVIQAVNTFRGNKELSDDLTLVAVQLQLSGVAGEVVAAGV